MRFELLLVLFLAAITAKADETDAARKRWAESPHGAMLQRILPPGFEANMLPEPSSEGARLALRYCVQCHNLANPAMHGRAKWPAIVERMVLRMQGRGNMGQLMHEMMAGVVAPTPGETRALTAYLRKHAMRPLDPAAIPEVNAPAGESFRIACGQCHELPDPQRYAAKEWPAVVDRMYKYMAWTNRAVSSNPLPGEPQLKIEEINAFLMRHARR
jgi:cytochrome c2